MELINKYIRNIKNTLQYYITNFWYNSFIYNNYVIPILWFDKDLDKYYKTKEEAIFARYILEQLIYPEVLHQMENIPNLSEDTKKISLIISH